MRRASHATPGAPTGTGGFLVDVVVSDPSGPGPYVGGKVGSIRAERISGGVRGPFRGVIAGGGARPAKPIPYNDMGG